MARMELRRVIIRSTVINCDNWKKGTLCWMNWPENCFDITTDGLYDAKMDACCGCGVWEDVCPVADCVTMVNEEAFDDNASQWEMWVKDKKGYETWMTEKISDQPARTHGFHHVGQYAEEATNESA